MKPDRKLVALLDEVRELAASGEVQGVFVVMAYAKDRKDPLTQYDVAYHVGDLDDMLLEVRQQVTRVRSRESATQRENRN